MPSTYPEQLKKKELKDMGRGMTQVGH